MTNINYKNYEENVVNTIQEYLDNNPQCDVFDQSIVRSDLFMDDKGNVVYAYAWKTKFHTEEGHGFHSIGEDSDHKYAILLTREQLKNELKAYAEKCN
jgi:hypothetical protein